MQKWKVFGIFKDYKEELTQGITYAIKTLSDNKRLELTIIQNFCCPSYRQWQVYQTLNQLNECRYIQVFCVGFNYNFDLEFRILREQSKNGQKRQLKSYFVLISPGKIILIALGCISRNSISDLIEPKYTWIILFRNHLEMIVCNGWIQNFEKKGIIFKGGWTGLKFKYFI